MALQKATVVNAGMYTNSNTFTRSLASSYQNMANQINVLSDIFTFGERAPVADGIDGRWEWSTAINSTTTNGTANPISLGLDGTSIFTYAGSDYGDLSYLFKVTNELDEDRPSTIYETFINYKTYIDSAIAERTNALTTIVANTTTDLSGVENGTVLVCQDEQISISNIKISDVSIISTGTLELVPSDASYATEQYLIVDPTAPNHIHIRAGGAIDESASALILGGELSGIRVEDGSYNHVTVYSKTVSGDAAHTWEFTEEGYIQTPSRADILDKYDYSSLTGGGNRVSTVTSADGPYTLTNASNIILVDFSASPDSPQITLPDSTETWLKVGYEITIADITGGAATNNIQILAGASDSIVGAPSGVAIDTDYGLLNLKYVGSQMWLMMYGR